MHLQDLVDLEKGDLVQLFYKYVTPLPQRLHQLRRAKRVIPHSRESAKGKSTIIRLTKRKSEDTAGGTDSKIARKEHSNIIKINKKPASLESIHRGINSVSINATLPILESKTGHENNSVNKTAKPKVVKLNRKTLGLNLNKSVEEQTLKQELQLSLNGGTQKEIIASMTSSKSSSDEKDSTINSTKKKFEKKAVTWP